jgi:hypothetical protein
LGPECAGELGTALSQDAQLARTGDAIAGFLLAQKKRASNEAKYALARQTGQGQVNRLVKISFEAPRASELMSIAVGSSPATDGTL